MSIMLGFFGALLVEMFVPAFLRAIGFYTTVHEGTAKVLTLFGKVAAVLDEPGLHLLWLEVGPQAALIPWLGQSVIVDQRLDQRYLRSQPVNSEEGAPMGIGIWYEMRVSDPKAFLFENMDPVGSLAANVGNATVRSLSNMPLDRLLQDRHSMSQAVRDEVGGKASEWGYAVGSVYLRKVHFRDSVMIRQIESKVVNRLRQVTAAILQDGENQVSIIRNTAERTAAIEFAKAAAIRPKIVGQALEEIAKDPQVAEALFTVLETERLLESAGDLIMMPGSGSILRDLVATES